jgi:hypothetical protein
MHSQSLLPDRTMAASALVALCAISSAAATFTHESFALAPANALSAAPLPVAEHVVPFTGKTPRRSHKTAALQSLRKGRPSSSTNYTDTLAGSSGDEEYLTAITIGGQSELQLCIGADTSINGLSYSLSLPSDR